MRSNSKKPPRICLWPIKKIIPENDFRFFVGDIEESYSNMLEEKGRIFTYFWFWLQIAKTIPPVIIDNSLRSLMMINNYFKIAIRNFKKHKINSFINIVGFSFGIAFSYLVLIYINDEISYDKFHENSDSIYTVVSTSYRFDHTGRRLPYPVCSALKEEYPEIKDYTRIIGRHGRYTTILGYEKQLSNEIPLFADPNFFRFFSFRLLEGNPDNVLLSSNSIVLTEKTALKYFGEEDPLGKVLTATLGSVQKDLIVTGLAEDPPSNSSIKFDFLINTENISHFRGEDFPTRWIGYTTSMLILLDESASKNDLEAKFPGFIDKYSGVMFRNPTTDPSHLGPDGRSIKYTLENIQDIHFSQNISGLASDVNDIDSLYIFSGIAFLILILVCFNYTNIMMSSISERGREIGIRKVLGAVRKQMTFQFLIETFIYLFISVVIGILLTLLFIGSFNNIMNKQLEIGAIFDLINLVFLSLTVFVTGLISTFIPGLSFARSEPVSNLSGKFKISKKSAFSKALIIVQFSISIVLLVSMIVMGRQIMFLQEQDIGFAKENLVLIETLDRRSEISEGILTRFKDRIREEPGIISATGSGSSFYRISYGGGGIVNGTRISSGSSNRVHYDFVKTAGLTLTAGRDFSRDFSSDATAAIVNEKLLEVTNLKDPIGTMIMNGGDIMPDFKIIGVVEDFMQASLDSEVKPIIMHMFPGTPRVNLPINYIFVRISGENVLNTIEYLENTWKELFPDKPFNYNFVDEDVERSLGEFRKWKQIAVHSAFLAILVTGMGLFCITSLIIYARIKEIGIRKVLGASPIRLFYHMTSEFILLVLIASIIACPIGYILMDNWLQNYSNRVDLGFQEFILTIALTFLLSLSIISYQTIKTAIANPVDSLRYE